MAAEPFAATINLVPSPTISGKDTQIGLYIQDEWKLKPHFTLRLGLRDEMTNGWNAATGICSNYISQNGVLQTDPIIGKNCLVQNNAKLLLQPRVGFAWDPTGSGKWAVRAAFGIHNDLQDNLAHRIQEALTRMQGQKGRIRCFGRESLKG